MIIEDSAVAAHHLENALGADNYTFHILTTFTGAEAVLEAERLLPDLIILDLILKSNPDDIIRDGFDVLAALMKLEKTRDIPVIIVTGLADSSSEEKGLMLGAADYIAKPFMPYSVRLRVAAQFRILDYIHMITELSLTDKLTGIPNRRSFDDRLSIEWKRAQREKIDTSILMIDIDKFKDFNDAYGHMQGDVALKHVAQILDSIPRRGTDFISRWGGEEFTVFLTGANKSGALAVAEKIRSAIENSPVTTQDGTQTTLTVSVGISSIIPTGSCSFEDFINRADKALYKAKNNGRNRTEVYEDETEKNP